MPSRAVIISNIFPFSMPLQSQFVSSFFIGFSPYHSHNDPLWSPLVCYTIVSCVLFHLFHFSEPENYFSPQSRIAEAKILNILRTASENMIIVGQLFGKRIRRRYYYECRNLHPILKNPCPIMIRRTKNRMFHGNNSFC